MRPSSCIVKGGIPSSRRYLPTYLRPESKRLTCSSFENTAAMENTVIYGVFKLVAHRLSPSAKLWRGLLGSGYRI